MEPMGFLCALLLAAGVAAAKPPVVSRDATDRPVTQVDDSPCSMGVFAPKPPVSDADPSQRHEETRHVATRLNVRLTPDGLLVGVDSSSTEAVVISVGLNMVVAMKCEVYYYEGAERVSWGVCPEQVELGLQTPHRLKG